MYEKAPQKPQPHRLKNPMAHRMRKKVYHYTGNFNYYDTNPSHLRLPNH